MDRAKHLPTGGWFDHLLQLLGVFQTTCLPARLMISLDAAKPRTGTPRVSEVANFGIASLLLVNNLSIAFLCPSDR